MQSYTVKKLKSSSAFFAQMVQQGCQSPFSRSLTTPPLAPCSPLPASDSLPITPCSHRCRP